MLTRDVNSMLRDMLILSHDKKFELILGTELLNSVLGAVEKTDAETLLFVLELFCRLDGELRYSVQPRILFDSTVARACLPRTDYSLNGLLNRVNALEKSVNSGVVAVKLEHSVPVQAAAEERSEKKVSALSVWGKMISLLRSKGMFALLSCASRIRDPRLNDGVMTANCEDIADYRILSLPENKKEISECLSECYGSALRFELVEPKGCTDEADLNKIKVLADSDVLKLL